MISWKIRRRNFFAFRQGGEVRLRYAYFITCKDVVKNAAGEVIELRCTYDPATRGGNAPDGRKVKATMHWVAAADAVSAEVRLVNELFERAPDPDGDLAAALNPNSLEVLQGCLVEPALDRENIGRAGAIRAARLFLSRCGFRARKAGVQSHHRVARHLGQGSRRLKISIIPITQA